MSRICPLIKSNTGIIEDHHEADRPLMDRVATALWEAMDDRYSGGTINRMLAVNDRDRDAEFFAFFVAPGMKSLSEVAQYRIQQFPYHRATKPMVFCLEIVKIENDWHENYAYEQTIKGFSRLTTMPPQDRLAFVEQFAIQEFRHKNQRWWFQSIFDTDESDEEIESTR